MKSGTRCRVKLSVRRRKIVFKLSLDKSEQSYVCRYGMKLRSAALSSCERNEMRAGYAWPSDSKKLTSRKRHKSQMMNVYVGIVLVILAAVGAYFTARSLLGRAKKKGSSDVKSLKEVVGILDQTTSKLTDLGPKVYTASGHVELIDYYEATLKIHEQFLVVMNDLAKDTVSAASLDSAIYLARDVSDRSHRLSEAFESVEETGKLNIGKLVGDVPANKLANEGCYFCSRPLGKRTKAKVTIDLGSAGAGKKKKVLVCPICLISLKERAEASVLHFSTDEGELHWSDVRGFLPNRKYWTINGPERLPVPVPAAGEHVPVIRTVKVRM